jgi:hypothetical protein
MRSDHFDDENVKVSVKASGTIKSLRRWREKNTEVGNLSSDRSMTAALPPDVRWGSAPPGRGLLLSPRLRRATSRDGHSMMFAKASSALAYEVCAFRLTASAVL